MKKLFALSGLAFLIGCSTSPPPSPPPAVIPTPKLIPAPITPPKPTINHVDKYWDGVSAGGGAASFAQSASTPDDWRLVEHRFNTATTALKSVPSDSPHYQDAQKFLKRFNQNAVDAGKMATGQLTTPPASLLDNSVPEPPRRPRPVSTPTPAPAPVTPAPTPVAVPSPTPTTETVRKRYYPRPVSRPVRRSKRR